MKILIIGGGAAGGTAAQFARKTDRKAEITVVDAEPYGQYSRCGLPYALRGIVSDEGLIEFSPRWFEKNRINALYGWRVVSLSFNDKRALVERGDESKEIEYDNLIIATGSRPWAPPLKGMDSDGVFFLRTIDDMRGIRKWSEKRKKALIIGAGLIGLESAESLISMGMDVKLVEFLPYPLPGMVDKDIGDIVYRILEEKGIKGYYSHEALEIRGNPVESVIIRSREDQRTLEIETDIVIISTGNVPNTEMFSDIEKGKRGHIRVNQRSETSLKGVYAAGDCTEYLDLITGEYVPMGMGTMAVRQGMAAGINAAGGDFEIHPYLGTRTTEIFGKEIAAVGATSDVLKNKGMGFVSAKFKGMDLPEYMNGENITVKVISNNKGRILGAQIMGRDASWRIAMFAEAILKGDDVYNLSRIETPYAPPIAPTLDASTIACTMLDMKLRRKK